MPTNAFGQIAETPVDLLVIFRFSFSLSLTFKTLEYPSSTVTFFRKSKNHGFLVSIFAFLGFI